MQLSRVLSPGLAAGSILSSTTTLLGDFRYIFSLFFSIEAFVSHPAIPQVLWGRDHLSLCVSQCLGPWGFALLSCYFFSIIFMRGLTHGSGEWMGFRLVHLPEEKQDLPCSCPSLHTQGSSPPRPGSLLTGYRWAGWVGADGFSMWSGPQGCSVSAGCSSANPEMLWRETLLNPTAPGWS